MPLLDQLKSELASAMKAGDTVRVGTVRFLLSAVRYAAIAKYGSRSEESVTDADVLDCIKKQAKTHRESVEAFTKAGRMELVAKEQAELTILERYLPKQISDDELKALLATVASSGEKNFGLLMGSAMKAVGGKADGGRVSGLLKKLLEKQ